MEIVFPLGDPQTWRGNKCQTSPRLTKYEATVILQRRAEQLDFNAPPLIDIKQFLEDRSPHGTIDPITIAQQELFENRLQMTVERVLPDGDIEYWNVQDLWQHTPT
jgi:DNA-directed RNA polymerase I, II, and III subunit RPABC2